MHKILSSISNQSFSSMPTSISPSKVTYRLSENSNDSPKSILDQTIEKYFLKICQETRPNIDSDSELGHGILNYFSHTAQKLHTQCSTILNSKTFKNENDRRSEAFKIIGDALERPSKKLQQSALLFVKNNKNTIIFNLKSVLIDTLANF